jgi:hypothetical protein
MIRTLVAFFLLATTSCLTPSAACAAESSWDVVIYGGTSAAVSAAVQVRQMNKSVVIVSPDKHLGGLSSGGLGWTDSGKKDAIGGLSRNFYHRIWKHYQQPDAWRWQAKEEFGNRNQSPPGKDGDGATMWVFEPHVAEKVFEDLVHEYQIEVHRDEWLDRDSNDGVTVVDERITAFKTLSGKAYQGKMFIDATYEGDLMAAAGISYHVGRESNDTYGETWNGVQVGTLHHGHWFKSKVDPYKIPGDPNSGLLWGISDAHPGIKGEADHRLQAYCFRMCLTNDARNRIPFPKPEQYDPQKYELLLRVFATGWREHFNKFDPIQNHKTDTNNHGPFSTDNIGMNYDYPEASYKRRQEIIHEHELYQKGLMYFMANDPRMPDDVRTAMAKWGLARDEFKDNGGWPHQIYVREARRMVGHYVMTEHDCLDQRETPDSVGMGSYTLDSHNVQRYVTPEGYVQNEGDIGVGTPRPYEISYGSIIPQKDECQNLLVPVCVSSSHMAFGSIRMEPVFMILGQSAATAACLSIDDNLAVQDLPYDQLKKKLVEDGQVLELDDPNAIVSRKLPGIVIDDRDAKTTGHWTGSSANRPFVDSGYQHDGNANKGASSIAFEAEVAAGSYSVRLSYPPNNNRATNTIVKIKNSDRIVSRTINQRKRPEIDGLWTDLGTHALSGTVQITVETTGTDGYVIVDAVQLLPQ